MVKSVFSFSQVQIKRMLRYAVKLCHASFSIAPKGLDSINMPIAIGKLIFTVMHPKMLIKANIHQTTITTPTIRVNDRVRLNTASDNALQRGSRAIWHNLCIHFAVALKQPKYNGFAVGTPSTLSYHSMCTKVGFIHFYRTLKRTVLRTSCLNSASVILERLQHLFLSTISGSYHTLISTLLPKTLFYIDYNSFNIHKKSFLYMSQISLNLLRNTGDFQRTVSEYESNQECVSLQLPMTTWLHHTLSLSKSKFFSYRLCDCLLYNTLLMLHTNYIYSLQFYRWVK